MQFETTPLSFPLSIGAGTVRSIVVGVSALTVRIKTLRNSLFKYLDHLEYYICHLAAHLVFSRGYSLESQRTELPLCEIRRSLDGTGRNLLPSQVIKGFTIVKNNLKEDPKNLTTGINP